VRRRSLARRLAMGFAAATFGATTASLGVVHFRSPVTIDTSGVSATTLTCASLQNGASGRPGNPAARGTSPQSAPCPARDTSLKLRITRPGTLEVPPGRQSAGAVRIRLSSRSSHRPYRVKASGRHGREVRRGDGLVVMTRGASVTFGSVRYCNRSCGTERTPVSVVAIPLTGRAGIK